MNIYDALAQVTDWRKREYFKWKYNIRYDQRLPKKTDEEFLRYVGRKTLNGFLEWEKSTEYKELVAIYLNSRISNDFYEIYEVISEKAKKGDEKSVKLFLQLQKEISNHAKVATRSVVDEEDEQNIESDDLILY